MRVIDNGPPKSGSTALGLIVQKGFGIPRARGLLRAGHYIDYPDDIYARMQRRDPDDPIIRKPKYRKSLKRQHPLSHGLRRVREGETIHGHTFPDPRLAGFRTITVLREPKNNFVSYYRAKTRHKGTVTDHDRERLARWIRKDGRILPWVRRIWEWRAVPDCLIVRYESLFEDETIEKIASFLGRDPVMDCRELYGTGNTWSGRPSDWREWFGADLARDFDRKWGHV